MASIRVKRDKGSMDIFREYKIVVDNKAIGAIRENEMKEFTLKDGEHEIWLKIDWCRSNRIKFLIKNDEIICFDCCSNLQGEKKWLVPLYITFARHKYLLLKEASIDSLKSIK